MKRIVLVFLLGLASFSPLFAEVYQDALSYIAENSDRMFITGKTDYVIHGMMTSKPADIYNELELVSYHVENDNESVILMGTVGEEWVTKVGKVISTYTHTDGTPLTADDFIDNKDSFIELRTIASPESNFALFVPSDTIIEVQTAWGDVLYTNASDAPHGDGDYLVCNNVDGKPDLSDVWVVNGAVFPSTYSMENSK